MPETEIRPSPMNSSEKGIVVACYVTTLNKSTDDKLIISWKRSRFPAKTTRKFGLGSLSMRAYFQIRRKGNELLKNEQFDIVFISTTAFHVMALGPGWKKKFGVPFVLDMQDPWRNDFFLSKPKS